MAIIENYYKMSVYFDNVENTLIKLNILDSDCVSFSIKQDFDFAERELSKSELAKVIEVANEVRLSMMVMEPLVFEEDEEQEFARLVVGQTLDGKLLIKMEKDNGCYTGSCEYEVEDIESLIGMLEEIYGEME